MYNFLFPEVKSNPKGQHFNTILDIQNDVMSELKSILAAEFHIGIQKLNDCASRCMVKAEEFFFFIFIFYDFSPKSL